MASDKDNERFFDSTANNPLTWGSRAADLHTASRVLRDKAIDAMHRPDWNNLVPGAPANRECLEYCGLTFQAAMLQAFAIECFLKCLWIYRGNKVAKDGRYQMPAIKKENHDIPAVADAVGFTISADERQSLTTLSLFGRSLGRYPISKKWQEQPLQTNAQGVAVGPTWGDGDHANTEAVLDRIKKDISKLKQMH